MIIKPGYLDGGWTKASWTNQGVRDKVGASHFPLATLLNMIADRNFRLERFTEGGSPIPTTLSFRAIKS